MQPITQITLKKKINKQFDIVRVQVMLSLYLNYKHLKFSHTEIDCITYLSIVGQCKINAFCVYMVNKGVYKHKQSVRNFITELILAEDSLIKKLENKEIYLDIPDVYSEGSCIINYFLGYKKNGI